MLTDIVIFILNMLKFISNTLISLDAFGFTYEFAYKSKQGQYKTRFGGFVTFFIYGILLWQSVI